MAQFVERSIRGTIGMLGLLACVVLTWIAVPESACAAGDTAVEVPTTSAFRAKLKDLGSTRTLEILPLVDWNTARSDLSGEAGVSYLVRTDQSTILFDVGGNLESADPSPLVANMRQLGIKLADIDTIVISHNHMDHVGGRANASLATFSLDNKQIDLRGKRVFVPIPMTYPSIEPVVAREPTVLAPGVATVGPITGKIYMGPVDEQALAIRVEGKGVVMIVGCGHQGLANLLTRSAQLFDEPLYGVIGGLHYPVPRGRLIMGGVDAQRWATYGLEKGPSAEDVQREIDLLAEKEPWWVALSPHDSSDETIEAFRKTFGTRYHDLRVGEAQVIGGAKP
jgi:7,8-dihydropterin-6-yl-methyl-4-(beta-D-ribofuranosyl)aminobenzene 5'-phosphate synthase